MDCEIYLFFDVSSWVIIDLYVLRGYNLVFIEVILVE